jgi:hypothetical protein
MAVPAPPPPPAPAQPFREPFTPSVAAAERLANLSPAQCKQELKRRAIAAVPLKGGMKGVAMPLRITGPIGGVRFITASAPSRFGVLDCRLALALDELAPTLAALGVAALRVDSMYRPHARLARRKKASQHAYGLAIDILSLELRDGRTLMVDRDWHAPIGSTECGPEARLDDPSDDANALRNVFCAIARTGIFHHLLNPSYDAAHRSHFHLDIRRRDNQRRR